MIKTQENRAIAIDTPLGKDVLLLQSMSGSERLGQMFHFELELLSEKYDITFADIVGQNITIRLNLSDGEIRYFNGYISRFTQTEGRGHLAHYRATVVPWLWFLTRTADCRIFQAKTIPEIIKEVFRDHGFSDIKDCLTEDYRKWDYCAQYRETDYNFVSRLMEQEGIYYFFEHDDKKHSIVLTDSITAHDSYPGYDEIRHRPTSGALSSAEYIWDWIVEANIQPGMYAVSDFDFENVRADLRAVGKDAESGSLTAAGHALADFEIFDYPGEYADFKYGEKYARARIEELRAQQLVCQARADARGIATGYLFELTDFPRLDQNRKYLVTSVNYRMNTDPYEPDSKQTKGEAVFSCEFTAISKDQPYRAPRVTPQPMIRGPQTATVVGPKGEKVFTDKYGRVKVQFHWDRYGKADENSSCWVRVSQNWAGKRWGGMHIPHIGQEVIVEFLEGDPDHPIITGRVYNADNMPPMDLPENKHKSIIRDDYGNEIVFDGTPGDEHITLYSPHHGSTIEVGKSYCATTGTDAAELFAGAKTETIGGSKSETIVGSTSEATLGFMSEFKTLSSLEAFAGWAAEFKLGPNYEISMLDKINTAEKDWLQQVGSDAIIDCLGEKKGRLILIAGPRRESVLDMDKKSISLRVGKGKSRIIEKTKVDALEYAMELAIGVAAGCHLTNAIGNIAGYSSWCPDPDYKGVQHTDDPNADKAEVHNLVFSVATHGMTLIMHFILMGCLTKIFRDQQKPDKIKEKVEKLKPKAEIKMTKDGEITIGNNPKNPTTIKITTDGNIELDVSNAAIKLIADNLDAKKAKNVQIGPGGALSVQ